MPSLIRRRHRTVRRAPAFSASCPLLTGRGGTEPIVRARNIRPTIHETTSPVSCHMISSLLCLSFLSCFISQVRSTRCFTCYCPLISLPLTDVFKIATSLLFDLPGVLHSSRVCHNDRGSPANSTAASWAALTKPRCFEGSQRKVMLHRTERRDSDQLRPLIIPKDRSSYSVEAACHESLTSSGDMQTKQLGSIVRGVGHVYSCSIGSSF